VKNDNINAELKDGSRKTGVGRMTGRGGEREIDRWVESVNGKR